MIIGLLGVSTAFAAFMVTLTAAPLSVIYKNKHDELAFWMMGGYQTEWSEWFCSVFDRVFGSEHISWKCFRRSAQFSIFAVLAVFVYAEFFNPILQKRADDQIKFTEIVLLAISVNVVADYLSLLETRYVIGSLRKTNRLIFQVAIMLLDLAISSLIIFTALFIYTTVVRGEPVVFSQLLGVFSYYSIFFYSTFITSVWSWFFFLAAILMRITSLPALVEYVNYERHAPKIFTAYVGLVSFAFISIVGSLTLPDSDGRSYWNRGICRAFQDTTCSISAELAVDPRAKLYVLNRKCLLKQSCSARDVGEIVKSCTAGDALACGWAGFQFEEGHGVPVDPVRAAELYQKGCDGGNGDLDSCTGLGSLYRKGAGVPRDPARAAELYQKACIGGEEDFEGCTWLGILYNDGIGVPRNPVLAAELYQEACDGGAGDLDGCSQLGDLYRKGAGVPLDLARAAELYQKACDGGEEDFGGCTWLGNLYKDGIGVPRNPVLASEMYQKACDDGAGNLNGCTWLGNLYEEGIGVPQDPARAAEFYQKACDGGVPDIDGCSWLGNLYQEGTGVPQDPARAAELYQKACVGGETDFDGCRWLGILYWEGLGVPRNPVRAAALFQRACDGGNRSACRLAERRVPSRLDGLIFSP